MFFYSESPFMAATGGTVTDIAVDGKTYRVHTFTGSATLNIETGGEIEYLIVGGGGAGGWGLMNPFRSGNGGNAGQMLTGSTSVSAGVYSAVVGNGGIGYYEYGVAGAPGSGSSLFSITASGGAAGGSQNGSIAGVGASGEKDGLQSAINGTATYYAGGGGAGTWNTNPVHFGGLGGGGNGAQPDEFGNVGNPGAANTGGGGGGGYGRSYGNFFAPKQGGNGGSGIVIVRYQIA